MRCFMFKVGSFNKSMLLSKALNSECNCGMVEKVVAPRDTIVSAGWFRMHSMQSARLVHFLYVEHGCMSLNGCIPHSSLDWLCIMAGQQSQVVTQLQLALMAAGRASRPDSTIQCSAIQRSAVLQSSSGCYSSLQFISPQYSQ